MSRYVQRVSLFPFSSDDVLVGWELEGVEGDVKGLIPAAQLAPHELSQIEFQRIPSSYLDDLLEALA